MMTMMILTLKILVVYMSSPMLSFDGETDVNLIIITIIITCTLYPIGSIMIEKRREKLYL